jgi:hypothetical protein
VVAVATHDLRAAQPQLPGPAGAEVAAAVGVDDPGLGASQQPAGRPAPGRVQRGDGEGGRPLDHAEPLGDHAAQPVGAALLHLGPERGRPAAEEAQRRQVVGIHHRVAGQGEHDRRDHDRAGGPVVLDQPEEAGQVEAGHGDHRRSHPQTAGQDQVLAYGVEERRHPDDHVVGGEPDRGLRLAGVGDQVGVGQLHPFGQAGGAARVGQGGQVAGRVDPDVGWGVARGEEAGERGRPLGLAEDEHLADPGLLGGRPGHLQERRDGDQRRGPGVGQLPGQLPGRQ